MPKADLITDVMGIYAYHSNSLEVFKRYIDILKPGGVLFMESYDFNEILPYIERNQSLTKTFLGYDGYIMVKKNN